MEMLTQQEFQQIVVAVNFASGIEGIAISLKDLEKILRNYVDIDIVKVDAETFNTSGLVVNEIELPKCQKCRIKTTESFFTSYCSGCNRT